MVDIGLDQNDVWDLPSNHKFQFWKTVSAYKFYWFSILFNLHWWLKGLCHCYCTADWQSPKTFIIHMHFLSNRKFLHTATHLCTYSHAGSHKLDNRWSIHSVLWNNSDLTINKVWAVKCLSVFRLHLEMIWVVCSFVFVYRDYNRDYCDKWQQWWDFSTSPWLHRSLCRSVLTAVYKCHSMCILQKTTRQVTISSNHSSVLICIAAFHE